MILAATVVIGCYYLNLANRTRIKLKWCRVWIHDDLHHYHAEWYAFDEEKSRSMFEMMNKFPWIWLRGCVRACFCSFVPLSTIFGVFSFNFSLNWVFYYININKNCDVILFNTTWFEEIVQSLLHTITVKCLAQTISERVEWKRPTERPTERTKLFMLRNKIFCWCLFGTFTSAKYSNYKMTGSPNINKNNSKRDLTATTVPFMFNLHLKK